MEPDPTSSSMPPNVTPSSSSAASSAKHKDRHIVSWSPEEDELLREQVGIHGIENWTSIAAQFKDKTGRQCRRRWFTYLNTECKKGGWSQEEDMLLCEAQKIFGNRWTEIAKVVSGRTDNAVKNRFNTLCKKRAKHETLKENDNAVLDLDDKNDAIFQDGCAASVSSESSVKKLRYQSSSLKENDGANKVLHVECGAEGELPRPPLAVIAHNLKNTSNLPPHHCITYVKAQQDVTSLNNGLQSSFLKRDDPKISALVQQAELLSSLAQKVNTVNSEQCLEDAWKELRDYLIQAGDCRLLGKEESEIDFDFLLGDVKELIGDLDSSDMESDPCLRKLDLNENSKINSTHDNVGEASHVVKPISDAKHLSEESTVKCDGILDAVDTRTSTVLGEASHEAENEINTTTSALPEMDFSSPAQTVPLFRSFAEAIPSPKFSASERHFLMSLLGVSSSSPSHSSSSQQPSCKKALLHSL